MKHLPATLALALLAATSPAIHAQDQAGAPFFRYQLNAPVLFSDSVTPPGGGGNTLVEVFPSRTQIRGRAPLPIDIEIAIAGGTGVYTFTDNAESLSVVAGATRDVARIVGDAYASLVYRLAATDGDSGMSSDPVDIQIDVDPAFTLSVPPSELASIRPGEPFTITPVLAGQIGQVEWSHTGSLALDEQTGELSGVAGAPGPMGPFVLSAKDLYDDASDTTDPFTAMVQALPISIAVSDTVLRLPGTVTVPVSVSGGYGSIDLVADLPSGFALADGVVSGNIADTGSQQAFTLGFEASDAYETPGGTASATVEVNPALSVAVPSFTRVTVNEPVFIPVTSGGVVGAGGLDLAAASVDLPAGLHADFAQGAIVGAATASETVSGIRLELTDSEDGAKAVSNAFSIRVNGINLPGPFTVPGVADVNPGALVASNPIPVEGYPGTLSISVSGQGSPAVSLDGGMTWSTSDDIASGQAFIVRQTAGTPYDSQVTSTVTIADRSAPFVVTTRSRDTTPVAFTIPAVTGAANSTSVTSAAVTVTGIEGSVPLTVTGGTVRVAGGGATTATTISEGQSFTVTATSGASYGSTVTASVTVGTYSTDFQVSTQNELVRAIPSGTNLSMQNYFTAAEWSSNAPKRVTVGAGAVIGSSTPGTPALRTGTGRGGLLVLENYGEIQGAGGAANGGTGGTALQSDQSLVVRNYGAIRSGGGGGGRGGNGGQGYTQTSNTVTEGPSFVQWSYYWNYAPGGENFSWNGSQYVLYSTQTSYAPGDGWTYYRGAYQWSTYYAVYRQRSQTSTTYTTGGVAGSGGRGQGYDGAASTGSSPVAGGTNAGASGASGSGGGWGAAGGNGSTGASGNYTGGTAGSAGGAPGYAIAGNHTLEVAGTRQGL